MVRGLGVLLPGVEISVSDVVSVSRVADTAAVHDTQHKQPCDRCVELALIIRMACHVDRKTDLSAFAS